MEPRNMGAKALIIASMLHVGLEAFSSDVTIPPTQIL
jgi:hypothetical protein